MAKSCNAMNDHKNSVINVEPLTMQILSRATKGKKQSPTERKATLLQGRFTVSDNSNAKEKNKTTAITQFYIISNIWQWLASTNYRKEEKRW